MIEEYFKVRLNVKGKIDGVSYQEVYRLSDLIMYEKVEFTWKEIDTTLVVGPELRKRFGNAIKKKQVFSWVGINETNLFGAKFQFKIMRSFLFAKIVNPSRMKKMIDVLEDGDPIRVKLIPGVNNCGFETMKIPNYNEATK